MTVDRAYRQEGLSLGQLALRLGLPEYRLRQLVNQELGYRNFAAFLNFDRIADAKTALAHPAQAEVPIPTIARCWLQLARSFQSRLQGRDRHDP